MLLVQILIFTVASEAHKKWGGHSQYGNKKLGGSATSLAIELTLFLANSGAAMAASAAAAPTPMYSICLYYDTSKSKE